ncbi:hypothetical protein GCM10007916_02730 [Psychromonas marina]|uniref:PilZ domain-containing protein n=1 Tax=Psychromonas marina TaxID=88364 RepID=A0ABQ6DWU2_9GAMM|nr:hypothetical protein [Psychromonas marina]GLS89206.1 hypothetical protein GCM10007916_02730 [Psychromonas marina]
MRGDSINSIINDDEFKLLSELNLDNKESDDKKDLDYYISAENGKGTLLSQLGVADSLQLVANYGKHRLVFPVQINSGDFSDFRMTFKAPKIFENGEHLRSWRLIADKTISLVDDHGEALHYKIKDLSASGISISIDTQDEGEFPELLNHIYLQLPNRERLDISGAKIHRVDNKTVAYLLTNKVDDTLLTTLTEYLFECHLAQYPDAYKDHFK